MPLSKILTSEKMPKHSAIVSVLPTTAVTNSTVNTSPKGSKNMPEVLEAARIGQPAINVQHQKWTQMLDFERVFKQIRQLDKMQNKSKNNNIGINNNNGNVSPSNKLKRKQNEVRQVQRLEDTEMHFYVTAPKQTSKELIICDACAGLFNKPGFNDHVFTQHPTKWTKIPTSNSELSFTYNDNSHDGIRSDAYNVNAEILGSPSDLSGTMSTCSNASSGSTSTASSGTTSYISALISGQPQKRNTKTGSSSEGSTGSGWRSRNKTKHHESFTFSKKLTSTNAELAQSTSTVTTTTPSLKKRTVKKGSSTSHSHGDNNPNTNTIRSGSSSMASTNKETTDIKKKPKLSTPMDALVANNVSTTKALTNNSKAALENSVHANSLFMSSSSMSLSSSSSSSSSSNCSYSLPPTPKMQLNAITPEAVDASAVEVSLPIESLPFASLNNSVGNNTIKKKSKNSGNYDCLENGAQCSTPDGLVLIQQTQATSVRPQLGQYQMTELDQAVSSITDFKDDSEIAVSSNSVGNVTANEEMSQPCPTDDGQVANNASDASAMLKHVLEEMLDSNFINEILNAENDINFDVHELNESTTNPMPDSAFVDEPIAKRMRFNNDILNTEMPQKMQHLSHARDVTHEYNGEYGIFPQAPTGSQQQHQHQPQQQQYNQYETTTMPLENHHYHQATNTIDAMQLQQLLYQQQQQQQSQQHQLETTVYDGINMNALNIANFPRQQSEHHTSTHVYNTNDALVDTTTKQIIELCSTAVGNNINDTEVPTKYTQDEYMGVQDMSTQFQLYNVPSLTDDTMDGHGINATNHHIVERQYVVPANDEEQLIYEITSNNSVVVLSQQHEQQVITEFLNQAATYEQQQQSQTHSLHNNNNNNNPSGERFNCSKSSLYDDVLCDFDYSLVDTVKSLANVNVVNNVNATSDFVAIKKESSQQQQQQQQQTFSVNTYHEDLYYNVFHYAGIPRPLAVNSFGLIKLPQGVASTLRKHLLTTRKLSNSLITLGGSNGLNGIVGQSSTVASAAASVAARINHSKQLPNYFTALAGANEFSIGSITITNSTHNNNSNLTHTQHGNGASQKQQLQQNVNSCYQDSNVNCTINSGGSGTTAGSLNTTASRGRHKSNMGTSNYGGTLAGNITNSSKHKFASGQCLSATVQVNVGTIDAHNTKTIIVSSAAALNAERNMRVIKRNLIAKCDVTKPLQSNSAFKIKKLTEIITGKKKVNITNNDISNDNAPTDIATDGQSKMERFYERRRKLISMRQQKQNSNHVMPYSAKQLVVMPSQQYHSNFKTHTKNHSADNSNGHMAASLTKTSDVNVTRVFM